MKPTREDKMTDWIFEDIQGRNIIRLTKDRFGTNHVDETDSITYVGKEDIVGNWLILKIIITKEKKGVLASCTYATQNNNEDITTYTEAWTNRTSLIYGLYSEAL